MATTAVPVYPDHVPDLTEGHLDTFKEWLTSAMGDEDKATDPEDAAFYEGQASMLRSVLNALYGLTETPAG